MAKKAIVKKEGPTRAKAAPAADPFEASLNVIVEQARTRARAEQIMALRTRAGDCRLKLAMMAAAARESPMAMDPNMREAAEHTVKVFEEAVACLREFDLLVKL